MMELNLGVDTSLFKPLPNSHRAKNIQALNASVSQLARGKSERSGQRMLERLRPDVNLDAMKAILSTANEYNAKCPDEAVEQKLDYIDWENDQVLLFVGRLIASKGIQSVVVALPLLFDRHPNLKLLVVGHGPLREPLEALLILIPNVNPVSA